MQARIYIFAVAVILLALASLPLTLQFPSSAQVSTFIGPRVWPLLLTVLLLLFGGALLVMTWRDGRRRAQQPLQDGIVQHAISPDDLPTGASESDTGEAPARTLSLAATRHWWLMAATVGYTLLMSIIGFVAASAIFTLLCTLLLGARSWLVIVITVVVAVVLMQGVFVTLLGIPLP
ncbi:MULTISPECIES: tripartite tricarboxylate transporter TctB family protein [Halomonadaceae]|jgi:putative tricarboxylic transport membrane protein|uniref:Tripartite tricarboxylate transporter TctB family protein n=1 Tax=Billgrantia desiderata TaxID=52021 RepID=A0AAW4YQB9_9GAMM|nr:MULTISPECIES: tripartite tricarboxylate transporter TctB family protein [Halomonas]MCE8030044.1 tripartite tricarboxylate transporter TctB family protein [Halomonas desiderata]MCE8039544.1 tripartite tricarboxylate transporter TctB family protein [Halomonas sp. MCCC 1A11062]MCE8044455.1 tripartite tricarboxylate transporter TctB family protein [Halomonas desiderata]MCE8049029.1 tripartite tricarboxylate transporter TctB family protein [Halomonas desiderata]MCE8050474.1 tripartite tricarboxy